jgi:Arc/MetJ-type ribon-helix-helix transcriptional regulator
MVHRRHLTFLLAMLAISAVASPDMTRESRDILSSNLERATPEDPEELYRHRDDLSSARRAADLWAPEAQSSFDPAWKLARISYWLGTKLPEAERRAARLQCAPGITYCHTMATVKVAITIQEELLRRVDAMVRRKVFPNRSQAIQAALKEKVERMERGRLARESAKLDPKFEQALAEEGMQLELGEWPEY